MCTHAVLALPHKFKFYWKKKKQPTVYKHSGEGSCWAVARQATENLQWPLVKAGKSQNLQSGMSRGH